MYLDKQIGQSFGPTQRTNDNSGFLHGTKVHKTSPPGDQWFQNVLLQTQYLLPPTSGEVPTIIPKGHWRYDEEN